MYIHVCKSVYGGLVKDAKIGSCIIIAYNIIELLVLCFIATHWFPYVKKRIQVIHQEQFELSAIEVQ